MRQTQIMPETDQHRTLTDSARRKKRSLLDLLREMLSETRHRKELASAAQSLLPDYQSGPVLTEITALDSESFLIDE